jgi:hypothetical protein
MPRFPLLPVDDAPRAGAAAPDCLRAHGCDEMPRAASSRALPVQAIAALLAQHGKTGEQRRWV